MELSNFFQLAPIPSNAMQGHYIGSLVALSYLIAVLASYVALDITERIRAVGESFSFKLWWLLGGALAMGMGIWTMHFIGMLAFVMPMKMQYNLVLTGLSLVVAVIASGFAFFLIKNDRVKFIPLTLGGVLLGLGICTMHYTGMAAMMNVRIHYIPSLFWLSVLIGIVSSEVALWLMIKSSDVDQRYHSLLKIGSALIMGFAICGMHYTGIAAAVFEDVHEMHQNVEKSTLDPTMLAFSLAATTLLIITIALAASKFWIYLLQSKNQKLIETEAVLEQKTNELQKLNENLSLLAEQSIAREERISAILTAAADGILVIDKQGIIEVCNQAVMKMLGRPQTEIMFHNISSFIAKKDPSDKALLPFSLSSVKEDNDKITEFVGLLKGNEQFPIELNISESEINNQELYIIVFRDISERKRSEENYNVLHQKLVTTARQAGMADVATSILHNVGNVLNSISITSQLLLNRNTKTQVDGLLKLVGLLQLNKDQLNVFLTEDPIGKILPDYLQKLAEYWEKEEDYSFKELNFLKDQIHYIKSIIDSQQSLSKTSKMIEKVQINALINDSLVINGIEKNGIIVERSYAKIPPFDIDKIKLLQILVNLTKNSMESVIESKKKEKKIILRTTMPDPEHILIELIDNGVGIKAEDMPKLFTYGYTTKKKGHGFGLHPSALSAQELGGELKAASLGQEQGATFTLTIPTNIPQETKKEHGDD